jgi:hypothetical protein
MSQELELSFFSADDGYKYIDTFKSEWYFTQQKDLSGPLYCENCRCYGSIIQDNVEIFLGYCANCADNIYEGKRGPGFFGFVNEYEVMNYEYPEYLSKYKTPILELSKHQMVDQLSKVKDQLISILEWKSSMSEWKSHVEEDITLIPSVFTSKEDDEHANESERQDISVLKQRFGEQCCGDCDCYDDSYSMDIDTNLSQKESEVYTDSDDE